MFTKDGKDKKIVKMNKVSGTTEKDFVMPNKSPIYHIDNVLNSIIYASKRNKGLISVSTK